MEEASSETEENILEKIAPTYISLEGCKWHDKFQNKIKALGELIENHKAVPLTEEASKESSVWKKKFGDGTKTKVVNDGGDEVPSEWEKIKTFHVKPIIFKMKELQMLVENEIKGTGQSISPKELKSEISDLKNRIVKQIRKELKAKHGIKDERDLEKKVHQMMVKEYVTEHLSGDIPKYLSEKSEVKVEEALFRIMSGKPGMLRRGLIRNKTTYQHLGKNKKYQKCRFKLVKENIFKIGHTVEYQS